MIVKDVMLDISFAAKSQWTEGYLLCEYEG